MIRVFLFSGLLFFLSCKNETCRSIPDDVETGEPLAILRKEKELFETRNAADVELFLIANPEIANHMLLAYEYPNLSVLASRISNLIKDPYMDTLYQESVSTFDKNSEKFIGDLSTAYDILKYYFPESKRPEIQTVVTGLFQDLHISDTLLIIGIDFFMGEDARYQPNDIPQYILKRYSYDYLPATLLGYATMPYIQTGKENTLLSEMIDYGKIYYLSSLLLPCNSDEKIIGYTQQELTDVIDNQEIIWAALIENEVLYETSEFTKRKFIGERPNIYEIGEKCPGRVGAWLGWQMVKRYMEKTGTPLHQMLNDTDHHKIFVQSGFKPKNGRQ